MTLAEIVAQVTESFKNFQVLQDAAKTAVVARDAARDAYKKVLDDAIAALQELRRSLDT